MGLPSIVARRRAMNAVIPNRTGTTIMAPSTLLLPKATPITAPVSAIETARTPVATPTHDGTFGSTFSSAFGFEASV